MKTEYRGVTFNKSNKYIARISYKNYQITLGHFDTAIDAAIRYDEFALLLYGRGAKLNFPIIEHCEVDYCNNKPYRFSKTSQIWMCKTHDYLLNSSISSNHKPNKLRNTFVHEAGKDYVLLEIYNGLGNKIKILKISEQDVEKVSDITWYVTPSGCPIGNYKHNGKYRTVNLGKYIIDDKYKIHSDGLSVHFKNKDKNDYRRENLFLRSTKQEITQDEKCKDIPGLWYDVKNDKYVVEKSIRGNKFKKPFKTFNEAIEYLNRVLCHYDMKPIINNVKDKR